MNPANRGTVAFLEQAGIVPGMRVLDLGAGGGDVTRAVARLVGPGGAVVGVDRDLGAIASARAQPPEAGSGAITYEIVDLGDFTPAGAPFDAIVGRRVLMYLADPAAVLRRAGAGLRAGGLVAFQEHAGAGMPLSAVALPLHRQVHGWMWNTVAAEGGDIAMGLNLAATYSRAGLVVEQLRGEAVMLAPDIAEPLAPIIRAMTPRIVGHGIATAEELDVDTLDARLLEERRVAGTAVLWDMAYLVSARKPKS